MRKGGFLIVLIASVLAISVVTSLFVLMLADLVPGGPMEKNQATTCLAFSFAVLVLGSLGMFVENPAPGYLCLLVGGVGTILAPVMAMPFLGLATLGSVFGLAGGHIDARKNRKARLDATKTAV